MTEESTDQAAPESQDATPEQSPLALVSGKPVVDLPKDLYIPPDALAVFLEAFEGPLDLLLYLIRRQNMNILDIDVSEITRQYMDYIGAVEAMRFELAAEYLVMAATLAEIKSRMLLPRQETDDEEEVDPRAELIRRLQQYERFKQAAEDIDEMPRWSGILSPPPQRCRRCLRVILIRMWTCAKCCWPCRACCSERTCLPATT